MGAVIAVLVNPLAGRGRRRSAVAAALAELVAPSAGPATAAPAGPPRDFTVELLSARTIDEALAQTKAAVANGAAALVVVGGDGTLNIGLQAVAGTSTPLGVIPAGTGNDFAVEMGIPTDLVAAARAIKASLAAETSRAVDLASMRGPDGYHRWFGAVLGAGFDAIVNERANAMRWPRGPSRYDLATYAELVRLRPRQYSLTLDGVPRQVRAVLVAVGNTASYGGGMRICPQATATDGLLDVVIGAEMSRTTLVRLKPRLYRGTHVEHPLVTTVRVRSVTIAADGITGYADGERTCPLPVTIDARPGALRLLG